MNKLKSKLESAVKSTAMSAQQIYKHKSFNLSKTQEDPEWDEPCKEFMKIHQQIVSLIEEVEKFKKLVTDLCVNMSNAGDLFLSCVNETDPEHTQKIANAYNVIVKGCAGEPLETATNRINDEIIGLLQHKLDEMKPLLDAIEQRKKAKMDYDHYYFKLEQLRGKTNSDPTKVIRNQDKFQEAQTALTALTDRIIDKFVEYETARPTFLSYEFQTLRSVQKDFFTSLAQSMSKFKSTEPQQGMPTEPLVTPFSMANALGRQEESGPRRPARARQSYEEEEEQDVPSAGRPNLPARQNSTQRSFRRPTPNNSVDNAFSNGPRKNAFSSRSTDIPDAVEEKAPPRKPKGVYAVVLYDFPGEDTDELPLEEGQKVRVIRQHESGWWTGEIDGQVGMFPANYVKLI